MRRSGDVIGEAIRLLERVEPVEGLDDPGLVGVLDAVEVLGRRVDALRIAAAGEVAERSRFEPGSAGSSARLGHRRAQHLVEQITRVSASEAARRIRLGNVTRCRRTLDGAPLAPLFPAVASALHAGSIGADAAGQIIRHLQQAAPRCNPSDVADAEALLVERAGVESADLVGMSARLWRDVLDSDGAQPREEELRARREFRLGRERNGMTPISGEADPVSAAKLKAMFAAYLAPGSRVRFVEAEHDDDRGPRTDSSSAPRDEAIEDDRTIGQRQFDVLMGVITAGMGADPGISRSKSTVVVTMTAKDYDGRRGTGWLDSVDEPVSAASVGALRCDGELRLLLLGDHGEPLWLGSKVRLFTSAQRLALAARDGGCVWPNCTAPPSWCDAHHVREFARGGPTDIDNGVLLCSAHHHALHASDLRIEMRHGMPRLLLPDRLARVRRHWTLRTSRVSQVMRR